MKKKRVGIILALVVLVVIAITAASITISSYHSNDYIKNKFSTQDIDVTINEIMETNEAWGGEKVGKIVSVKNDKGVDLLVRVAIISRWVDENGNAWPGDTSYIRYEFSDCLFDANDTNIPLDKHHWVYTKSNLNDEQYFYYNDILRDGEETEKILKAVSVFREADYNEMTNEEKEKAGNYLPEALNYKYRGKKLIVDVKVEAVQAQEAAMKATWGETTGNVRIDEMLKSLCKR